MRCKRDETQNTSDEKYISQIPENKTEIYANQKKDRAEMDSLACKVSLYFNKNRFWNLCQHNFFYF